MKFSFLILFLYLMPSTFAQGTLFSDSFDNNNASWQVGVNDESELLIDHGHYLLNHKSDKGALLIWGKRDKVNWDADFKVTLNLKQYSGEQEYGYGFIWGAKDERNFYAFTISSNGYVSVYKFEEGRFFEEYSDYTSSGVVKKIGYVNEVSISSNQGKTTFLVNGQNVYTSDSHMSFGDRWGFVVNKKKMISIESISIDDNSSDLPKDDAIALTWVKPSEPLISISQNILHVEVGVNAINQLQKVELYLNDVLVRKTEGYSVPRGNVVEFDDIITEEVLLADGLNSVKLKVYDVAGNVISEERIVKSKHEGHLQRTDRVLIFATNVYDHWHNLVNPVTDAKTLGKTLSEMYGFEVEIVENPTTVETMSKLKEYSKKEYGQRDQLMIFFAGHGKFDKDFGEGYVVCKNSFLYDDGNASYLSHSTLRTVINHVPCNHTMLFMDVCFGGTFDPTLLNAHHRGVIDPVYSELSKKQFIETKLQYKTRLYLTSGGNEYVPDGTPGNHSPFVRKVLEGLRSGGGSDGILTHSELLHYLERVKPEPRYGEFGDNEPGSDFLFIRK